MCQLFAGKDPGNYEKITRSIRLGGHSTSIYLEAIFGASWMNWRKFRS
jgi:predicted DNA-binding ribbon-helix-helix protein